MKNVRYHCISLPIKSYIRKYAESVFGSPVKADHSTSLGCFINACLEKNVYSNRHLAENFIYKDVTDKLPILINSWQFNALGFDFSDDKVIQLNRFLENVFEEDLFRFCQSYIDPSKRYKGFREAIEKFCSRHKIELEIDVTFDAIKKIEYRKRKKIEDLHQRTLTLFSGN